MKRFIAILIIAALGIPMIAPSKVVSAEWTSGSRTSREKQIAQVCIDNWDKYGVLPSVCLAQAYNESTLGEHCPNFNLWGICSWTNVYNIEDATLQYLRCINNGYYGNAPFQKDWQIQLNIILDHGYCEPVGDYYNNCTWLVNKFNLTKYDDLLFKELRQREEKKEEVKKMAAMNKKRKEITEQENTYIVLTSASLPSHCIQVSEDIATKGTVGIVTEDGLYCILDVIVNNNLDKNTVIVSNEFEELNGKCVELDIHEEAKG